MGSNPPPPCPKDTWRPHIRRRRPPCPKGGVRTLIIGALRHIRSPLDLQDGPRGSKIEKRRDRSKYVYHNEIYMWRPSEGGIWPIKAQNPRMNALTRLPSTKTNKNTKGDPLRCCCSHQMDQHVLVIQGENSFSLDTPSRPWYTSARNCSEAPTNLWMRQIPSNGPYIASSRASPGLACPSGSSRR